VIIHSIWTKRVFKPEEFTNIRDIREINRVRSVGTDHDKVKMDKLEYSKYLDAHWGRKGMFVVMKGCEPPYSTNSGIARIQDVQEIHWYCNATQDGMPMPFYLNMCNHPAGRGWWSSLDYYKPVMESEVPREFLVA